MSESPKNTYVNQEQEVASFYQILNYIIGHPIYPFWHGGKKAHLMIPDLSGYEWNICIVIIRP